MRKTDLTLLVAIFLSLLFACTGSHLRMTTTHAEQAASVRPIEDTLVIVVVDDHEIRSIFENHFKKWLAVKGVEAIISSDVLPVQVGVKLEKQAIVDVVDKYGNDSVLVTRLVGIGESEVFSRDLPQVVRGYYGYYNYAWGYIYWPTITGEKLQLTLETRLYEVTGEALIWAGESHLTNPETPGKAIGQVVEAVMMELEKNGLLPQPS